jgi:hypothetical protein
VNDNEPFSEREQGLMDWLDNRIANLSAITHENPDQLSLWQALIIPLAMLALPSLIFLGATYFFGSLNITLLLAVISVMGVGAARFDRLSTHEKTVGMWKCYRAW